MIIDRFLDWLLAAVTALGAKLAGIVPDPPAWVSDGSGMVSTVLGYALGLGSWVPVGIFGVVVASVVVCLVAGLVIKVARIVASFLTIGGGSAG